jgi:hypothetical protein
MFLNVIEILFVTVVIPFIMFLIAMRHFIKRDKQKIGMSNKPGA